MLDDNNVLPLPVQLKMNDGRELNGNIIANIGGELARLLNNEMRFVLFVEDGHDPRYIAKDGILECVPVDTRRQQRVVA